MYNEVKHYELLLLSKQSNTDEHVRKLRLEHFDKVQKISIPFFGVGVIALISFFLFDVFFSPTSILMLFLALFIYLLMIAFENKTYNKRIADTTSQDQAEIDEIDLEILREQLSPEELEQLAYEHFGKKKEIKVNTPSPKKIISHTPPPQENISQPKISQEHINSLESRHEKKEVYKKYMDLLHD